MSKLIKRFILVGGVISLIVLGYGAFVIYFSWPVTLGNVDKAGVFGDSFGILTSLFSGLAFAGIILSVISQNKELKLQREELKDTKEELRLTREEFKTQNATLQKQRFESTLFQMVRLHHEIVAAMVVKAGNSELKGRRCFLEFTNTLFGGYRPQQSSAPDKMELIEASCGRLMEAYASLLGHYFRNLYTIFKLIHTSEVEDKRLYSNIVRAQLSDNELLVLFYNCLCKYGREKFKPLAEEFALFNNLPRENLLEEEHQNLIDEKAFGSKVI